jgi:hypothetical protein
MTTILVFRFELELFRMRAHSAWPRKCGGPSRPRPAELSEALCAYRRHQGCECRERRLRYVAVLGSAQDKKPLVHCAILSNFRDGHNRRLKKCTLLLWSRRAMRRRYQERPIPNADLR